MGCIFSRPVVLQRARGEGDGKPAGATCPKSAISQTGPAIGVPVSVAPKTSLRFTLNSNEVELENPDPTTMLVDWLRGQGHTGTKKSCGEGGCGACAVGIEWQDESGNFMTMRPSNSCLVSVCALDGARVTTIEGLGSSASGYHPLQEHLAHCNGSQCGFCSPGMVMSMYTLLQENPKPTADEIEHRFDGNICRCTGYRPILDAFHSVPDIEDVGAKCRSPSSCAPETCSIVDKGKRGTPKPKDHGVTLYSGGDGTQWTAPSSLSQLCDLVASRNSDDYAIVSANTGRGGVQKYYNRSAWGAPASKPALLISVSKVPDFNYLQQSPSGLDFGANTTLQSLLAALADCGAGAVPQALRAHVLKVATTPIRSTATVGGNLCLHWKYPLFPSCLMTIFAGCGATVTLVDAKTKQEVTSPIESVSFKEDTLVKSVCVKFPTAETYFKTYKVGARHQNAHAIVNAAFCIQVGGQGLVTSCRIFYGGVCSGLSRASKTEAYLEGKNLAANGAQLLSDALGILSSEVLPSDKDRQKDYKTNLVKSLFYKFFLSTQASLKPDFRSAAQEWKRPISKGTVDYDGAENKKTFPVSSPVNKIRALGNCAGENYYTDDLPQYQQSLHGAFVISTVASSDTFALDYQQVMASPGVVLCLDAAKLAKEKIGNSVSPNEPLFAESKVAYVGQRLALIVADTQEHADDAVAKVKVTYGPPDHRPILTIQDAIDAKSFFSQDPETFSKGDASGALSKSEVRFKGSTSCGHQHHFYMEVQTACACPSADGLKVQVSTQGPGLIAGVVASSLGMQMSQIEVEMTQAGGAYGGKSSKSVPTALAAALASHFTKKPCKMRFGLNANLANLGSRRPHRFDYEVGCDHSGRINAIVGTLYYLQGAFKDFGDTGGLDVIYMSIDGAYNVPNWDLKGYQCLSNTPGNTFCRGPVFLPGTFIIEQILDHTSHELGLDPLEIRRNHVYQRGDVSLAGQKLTDCNAEAVLEEVLSKSDYASRVSEVEDFNKGNRFLKRGLGVLAAKYMMNPCTGFPVIVSVNEDASVLIQHSGCEIGQGLSTKVIQTAAYELHELGVDIGDISCSSTSSRVARRNNVTGGSTTSEAVCASTVLACADLCQRIMLVHDKLPKDARSWKQVVTACVSQGVNLVTRSVYSGKEKDPGVLPDGQDNGPSPYVGYGAAAVEAQIDVLTGETNIIRVDIVQDNGISLNVAVDVGQVQGSFVMGLGYFLTEEFVFDRDGSWSGIAGSNLANGTWTYKPMSSLDIPIDFNISLLPNTPDTHGVLGSKSVGEPPLILSSGVVSAVRAAVCAFLEETGDASDFCALQAPCTVERIQLSAKVDVNKLKMS